VKRRALEYVLPGDVTAPRLRAGLATDFDLEAEPSKVVDRAYFDTFDGLVRQADMSLVWENGRLQLMNGDGREVACLSWPNAPTVVRASDLPSGALRERLAPVIAVRAATALVRVRVRQRVVRVLDAERKTVACVVIAQPSIVVGDRARRRLTPRLTVTGVQGYAKALGRVRDLVEHRLGLSGAGESLRDEAVARAGGIPGGMSSALEVALQPRQRVDHAAVAILSQLIAAIEANLPGTLADVDSEFLHDLRVAVRRTRSLQRELGGAFPQADLARFRAEFRWLQEITGPARDLDVYLLDFEAFAASLAAPQRFDLEPLRALLSERRRRERRRMARALRSQHTHTLLAEWKRLVETLPELPDDDRPDAAGPIVDLAGGRIAAVYRQMLRRGARIDDQSPPVALHDLRKKGKELRYLLEFFGGLFPKATVDPTVKALKSLQDTLGRFQDREVQAMMLRSLAQETAGRQNGAAALMAMGVLVERLTDQQAQARAEFARRFASFADRRRRTAMRETFA